MYDRYDRYDRCDRQITWILACLHAVDSNGILKISKTRDIYLWNDRQAYAWSSLLKEMKTIPDKDYPIPDDLEW